ncbi:2-aminoethylphosphonate ABC transporter permease subunit [Amycolatopsis sp. H20-H5]|uniref:2-aminoethylphosphonate ABC transporter permease subunit n=1 Tax=Amycolatopsis sp. H20-H5 TaxID=3046309 RepID=UPI002DBE834B|nr:2-aminoethylphosphonate ABC transporter permease subunit [Amycolatopsis sp. H20-H5]MEC3974780.1 2-aminoethylphosphonate ABC transporter permease subunit [Amycolatopsis sp. H20-H5]
MSGLVLEAVAPRRVRERGQVRRGWLPWLLPPLVVLLGFFGYPLVLVAAQSLESKTGEFGLSVWAEVLGSSEFLDAAWRTVALALGSTVGCVLLGTFLALVIAFVPFPGARTLSRLVDTVLAFPSFLIALAFTFLYGSAGVFGSGGFLYSPWGVLLAEITFYTPFVMRPALAGFSQVSAAQMEVAASLGAKPGRVLWRVILPEAVPALASGACLTMLLAMNEFGIVLFLGAKDVTTLPTLIYSKGIVTFDFPQACVVAMVNVALSLVLYGTYRWAIGRGERRAAVDAA